MHFTTLGSHPKLSLAELHAIYPNVDFSLCGNNMAIFDTDDWNDAALMNKLGGTVKLGDIILQAKANKVTPELIAQTLADLKKTDPDKNSLDFGWTIFHAPKSLKKKLDKFPIQIKKQLKGLGFSTRWVTSKNHAPLTPAAVAKCKLTQSPNADLCVCAMGDDIIIGRTTQVQDADAWSLRDYGRPIRDSLNGMLPPKLARILVNLASATKNSTILDPFCGSGTILMEAALATNAPKIIGSDIEARQVASSQKNIDWLISKRILRPDDKDRFHLFTADVKQITDHLKPKSIDCIVTEGWLGPPLKGNESQKTLDKNANAVTELWLASLKALKPLLKPNATLVIITPQYRTKNAQSSVNIDVHLDKLGFKKSEFAVQSSEFGLLYSRPNQYVERKILVIEPITA